MNPVGGFSGFSQNNGRNRLWLMLLAWGLMVISSFVWNFYSAQMDREETALQAARSIFKLVVLTRLWNAQHGGVYVPVTRETQPNPYLDVPRREIEVNDSLTLTKVNPAFMTRQLSEIAQQSDGVQFHITSLKPIRPANKATLWEAEQLQSFERGITEVGELTPRENGLGYRYMAPLRTDKACLSCHEVQGYKEGEVRGGIGVYLPRVGPLPVTPLLIGHAIIFLVGAVFIVVMERQAGRYLNRIQQFAIMDALTGVPNRRYFSERIIKEFRRGRRDESTLSLLICDIDFFKRYNDTYGHQAGDVCLQSVALTLQSNLQRGGDFIARYGGEEFVVVLPSTPREGAIKVAEVLRRAVHRLAITHRASEEGVVTVSIGVAHDSPTTGDHEILIRQADQALYRAKANGRNRVVAYSSEPEPDPLMEG